MARPRTLRSPDETDGVGAANIDHQALASANEAATERAQQISLVDAEYGVDLPYNVDLYIATIRRYAAESATRLVQIGCMLIQLHERESLDDYRDILERIGIGERFAQRARQAAVKLRDRKTILQLGVSKALELMTEDDADLDALEAGGALFGATLDDIDRMTVRELKETLRTERKERSDEKAADEEIIRGKDDRINKLMRSKRKLETSSVRAQVDDLLRDMDEVAVTLAQQATLLVAGINDVRRAYDEAGEHVDPEVESRITQNVQLANEWLHELAAVDGE